MPLENVEIVPFALTDLESARDECGIADNSVDSTIKLLVNSATGLIERKTHRKLKSRTYDGATGNEAAFYLSGNGSTQLAIPEWPITALSSAKWRDENNALTTIVTTGARFLETAGVIFLAQDAFPKGIENIEIKCTAGYLAGTHDGHLAALDYLCRRYVQILWQDLKMKIGRGTSITVAGLTVQYIDAPLPKDLQSIVNDFSRIL